MKLTTGILVLMVMAGSAGAQNPTIIQNTRDSLNAVQQQKTADSNAALDASQGQAKPTPAKTAASGKPAPSKPATSQSTASTSVSTATKPATANGQKTSPTSITKASGTASPKAPPIIVQKANPTVAPKAVAVTIQKTGGAALPKTSATPGQTNSAKSAAMTAPKASVAPASASKSNALAPKPATAPKAAEKKVAAKPLMVIVPKPAKSAKKAQAKPVVQAEGPVGDKPAQEKEKKYAMTGKRDPFVSPVVNHMGGSACSTGKKCLEIAQINLKGVVRSDGGMIAVVTNSMNKAYFLRENDPVFNGYVERITGDSITFKETFQDRLGKSLTRDVVKKIVTPAV